MLRVCRLLLELRRWRVAMLPVSRLQQGAFLVYGLAAAAPRDHQKHHRTVPAGDRFAPGARAAAAGQFRSCWAAGRRAAWRELESPLSTSRRGARGTVLSALGVGRGTYYYVRIPLMSARRVAPLAYM